MHFSSALAVSASLFLFSTSARSAALQSRALSGEATFYGGNLHGGSCSFSTYTLPSGVYGTALSDSNWDNAANCGACISVTGPGGNSITAMIVDECPGCGLNHLDLFPDAFAALAEPSKGVVDVTWSYIDCPITTPLQLHNKDGASEYWFSMQVVNAVKPIASLSVSTDGGETWTATERQSYNFFQHSSGFGTTTVDVMIATVDGDEVVVKNVQVASGASMTTTLNFGAPHDGDPAPAPSSSPIPTPTPTPTPKSKPTPKSTSSPVTYHSPEPTTSTGPAPTSTKFTSPPPPPPPPPTPTTHHHSILTTSSSSLSIVRPTSPPALVPVIQTTFAPVSIISVTWTTIVRAATTTKETTAQSTTTVYVYEDCKA